MASLILAGDVGGTKINLALFRREGGQLQPVRQASFPTAEAASLEAVVDRFLGDDRRGFVAAAFGVAGPVQGGVARLTNVPWSVDAQHLAGHLGLRRTGVINDLVAMGYGVSALPPDRFAVLNAGRPDPAGNGALIAAGTGLGEAILIDEGATWHPVPSEGGHASFAPNSTLEDELLVYLRGRFHGHVSCERVLSGPGLHHIYQFLRDTGRGEEFDWMAARLEGGNQSADSGAPAGEGPARVIGELALERASPLCEQALEMFVSIYGAAAGNLALTALATGGVFLGGGIAPKILPALQGPAFLAAFFNKGRLSGLLRTLPVKVLLEPKAPLYGAALHAESLIHG